MTKSTFRLRGRFVHCTYKNWLCEECIREVCNKFKKRSVKLKIAHESGKDNEETPYEHTHCLMVFDKAIDCKNERAFDVGDVHPHIKTIQSREQYVNVFRYLDKENCIFDECCLEDYPIDGTSYLRNAIQGHLTWNDVMNDPEISDNRYFHRCMMWARDVFNARPVINQSMAIQLRNWQSQVFDWLIFQNSRNILWIFDAIGNQGKSVLANWLIDMHGAFFCSAGKYTDIAFAFDNQKYVVFDLPRTSEDFTPYKIMEELKNGRLFSPKYRSCTKRFKPPTVVVFANFLPKVSSLSMDRWLIKSLDNGILTDLDAISLNPVGSLNINGDPRGKCFIEI